jgi:hypothetical protein
MTISRYDERKIIVNGSNSYVLSDIFKSRDASKITQFTTPELKYPDPSTLKNIKRHNRIWGTGSKYFKLAHEFYGDPQYWWVIAWFNLRPLESSFRAGDTVVIPTPLETVLSGLGLL